MEKQWFIILKRIGVVLLIVAGVLLGLFALYKLSIYLAPFVIAYAVSSIMEPIIRFLIRKTHIKRKLAAVISLLLVLSTLGLIITLIIFRLVIELKSFGNMLPQYYSSISSMIDKAQAFYSWLPSEVTGNLGNVMASLSSLAVDMLNSIAKGAVNTAISIPQMLIFILATIISTFFMASDREKIITGIKTQFPISWVLKVQSIKNEMFSALFGYIRAQLILMTVTFTVLSIGLSIVKVGQPFLIALCISFVDALPILGTGGVMIPWALYQFIVGNISMGVSLLIIYIVALVVRQTIEPKVLGQQIGIHPLVTLITMYTGLKVLGVAGLIVGPVTFLLVKTILKGIYKDKPLKDIIG